MNITAPPGFLDAENNNRGSNGSKVSLPDQDKPKDTRPAKKK